MGRLWVLLLAAPLCVGLPPATAARGAEGPPEGVELPAETPDEFFAAGFLKHMAGELDEAIVECEKAIQIDPDYGNPWNDIGSYLLAKGDLDRAIPYLKRATEARRYCCPQFPHLNLGGIYAEQRRYREAKREFERVLELVPGHLPAIMALKQIEALLAHEAPERI